MPSKGSPRLTLRLSGGLEKRLAEELARHNRHTKGEHMCLSDFARCLIGAELDHRERSRRPRTRRNAGVTPQDVSLDSETLNVVEKLQALQVDAEQSSEEFSLLMDKHQPN